MERTQYKDVYKNCRVIGILHKLRHSFPQRILRLIYNSLIHPHLIYGLYLWVFNPKRLTILQKRAVRILALRPYLSHSTPLFKSLKILKLEDLYIIQQGWGQVQLTKYSSTSSIRNMSQVQVLVKYSFI